MERPEIVIFDWDNTLVDAWLPIHHAIQHTFSHFGKPTWNLAETKKRIHRSLRDSLPEYFPNIDINEVATVYRDAYRNVQKQIQPLQGAVEVLRFLQAAKIYTAIISNKQNYLLNKEIEGLNWQDYFHKVIGSGDLPIDKPSAETVLAITKEKTATPNKIWFIGDSETDVETAQNTGCVSILFGDDDYNHQVKDSHNPDVHITNHQQLLAHFIKFS